MLLQVKVLISNVTSVKVQKYFQHIIFAEMVYLGTMYITLLQLI